MNPNKTVVRLFVILISWALILQSSPVAVAENPASDSKHFKELPSESFGFLHIKDVPKIISDTKDSVFFKTLLDFVESEQFNKIRKQHEKFGIVADLVLTLLERIPKAFTGEFTFAFIDIDREADEPDIAFIVDVDEKEFRKLMAEVFFPAVEKLEGPKLVIEKSGDMMRIGPEGRKEGLFYEMQAGRMVFCPFPQTFDLLKSFGLPVAENPVFESTFEKHASPSDALIFVNLGAILDAVGENDGPTPEFLRLSGLSSIAGIGVSTKSIKNGGMNEITLYAPEGLSGILSLLNRPGSGPSIEKYVPEDYSVFVRLSVGNFGDLYKEIITFLTKELGEDSYFIQDLKSGIEEMEKALDISFEKDLLASLGGEIAFALKMPEVLSIPEMAAFLEVKDAEKIRDIFNKIIPEEVSFAKTTYKDIDIFTTEAGAVQPSYAFLDNYLVVGISPGVIKEIIDTRSSRKSLLTKNDYKTVFADLPEKGLLTIYLDTTTIFNSVMPWLQSNLQHQQTRFESNENEKEEISLSGLFSLLLASCQENIQGLPGTGIVVTSDEKRFQIKQFSCMGPTSGVAILIGSAILFPALSTSRESSRSARSMNNVKQLCLGQMQHALDNKEVFAEKFSDLYPNYTFAFHVFQHPSTKNDPITKKEDIDKLTDYEIFPGLTKTSPSDFILIYEKEPFFRGGRNVGYVDGSARWLSEERFQEAVKQQKERIEEEKE